MPLYIFKHPTKEKYQEVFFHMDDDKFLVEDGVKWKRVFTAPNYAIDSDIDPMSSQAFMEKTNKEGTVGELMDRSKDLSQKREDKYGYDPVKQKYFKEYSKKRNGIKHHLDR